VRGLRRQSWRGCEQGTLQSSSRDNLHVRASAVPLHDGREWANPENYKLPPELIEQDLAFAPVCEERNRNLLRSRLPICIVSAHFKFPTGVHHVDVRRSAENPLFSIAIF
jgi:hypothetical protein